MEQISERIATGAARVVSIGLADAGTAEEDSVFVNSSDATAKRSASRIAELTDTGLATAIESTASLSRDVQAIGALLAAEVARRSRPELGYAGLAQSSGHRTAEAMIQSITKAPYSEAARSVKVGALMANADAIAQVNATMQNLAAENGEATDAGTDEAAIAGLPVAPWSEGVTTAVSQGFLSITAADSIMRGLGEPADHFSADALRDAAVLLVHEGAEIGADQLFRRARQMRDALDRAGVADRDRYRFDQRFLRIGPEIDGLRRISGLLDPESAAIVGSAIDAVTSPRRGGPRFVDPTEKLRAEAIIADPRSTEQLALDALVQMIRIASEADPNTVFGKHRPAVRMIVMAEDLREDTGTGFIEGAPDAVPLSTIKRGICDSGIVPVLLDSTGQALDVGQEQRLFTSRQRVALAIRDGGCMIPGCDRPPSWTEAHHIDPYSTGGKTDLRDGILLCRHHHMLIHNNGWEVQRTGSDYWLKPPRMYDPAQSLIQLASKNPIVHDLAERERQREHERQEQGREGERKVS